MFRMEFRSLDAVEENDEPSGTNRDDDEPSKTEEGRDSSPKVYEGRVGQDERMQRFASSNEAVHSVTHPSPVMIRSQSSNVSSVGSKDWVEVDLIDFGSPKAVVVAAEDGEGQAIADEEVLRELVKPFAESVSLDTDGFVTFLDSQPVGVEGVEAASASPRDSASLQARSNSTRSTSSSWSDSLSETDAESSAALHGNAGDRSQLKDEERSPATRAYNRAFNRIMHKKHRTPSPDANFAKPWEPLLAEHEQVKLQRKLQKEATLDAKRLAQDAKKDAERQQRELLDLANPVPASALKTHREHVMRKGLNKLFHIPGTYSTLQPSKEGVRSVDARESKLVMPRGGIFADCVSASTKDAALTQIRSCPRPTARKDLQFATVESNQRDVEPWTMEEYMAKNARLTEWNKRVDEDDFGTIEGNQLLNQYFGNDFTDDVDSDSD